MVWSLVGSKSDLMLEHDSVLPVTDFRAPQKATDVGSVQCFSHI